MTRGKYERELRDIFEGDSEEIENHTATFESDIEKKYRIFERYPFLVSRGAGSLGVDLLAVRGSFSAVIEVKSSKEETIYLSGQDRLQEQLEDIREIVTTKQVLPLYAFRLKSKRGEKWSLFTLDMYDILDVNHKQIMTFIPNIQSTKTSYKMEWNEGLVLSEFADSLSPYILTEL